MSLERALYLRLTVLAVMSACVGALIAAVGMWAAQIAPPMVVTSARALTPQVGHGGSVLIEFAVTRNRACPAVIYGFLTRPDGRALHRYDPELGGYSRTGSHPLVVLRDVPAGIVGEVCYRHTRMDSCTTRTYIAAGPEVCFEVLQ